MSTITPHEFVAALRDWHVPLVVHEFGGVSWHRNTSAGGWNPHGVLHHHTAGSHRLLSSSAAQLDMARLLWHGRSDLPGPLAHLGLAYNPDERAGVAHVVGWGNANHAGMGSGHTLDRVIAGEYIGQHPGADDTDGNPYLYGLEYMHPGDNTEWPDELLHVGHLAAAAICDAHGWAGPTGARSNLEHREWTGRKIDRSWRGDVRRRVAQLLADGPEKAHLRGGGMTPKDVWTWDGIPNLNGSKTNPNWTPARMLSHIEDRQDAMGKGQAHIGRTLDNMAAGVGAMRSTVDELARTVAALGSSGGGGVVDVDELTARVRDAAESGARAALDGARIVTDDPPAAV